MSRTTRGAALALTLLAALGSCTGEAPESSGEGYPRVENPADGRWGPGEAWRLVQTARIGGVEGSGPEIWGSVGDVMEGPDGRIYAVDNQAGEIRTFTADGAWVRTFGRVGEGPGEIGLGAALLVSPTGHLWLHDARNQRFTVFDTTGTFVRDHPIRSAAFVQGHRFAADGTFLEIVVLARGGERSTVVVRHRLEPDDELLPGDTFAVPQLPATERVTIRIPQGLSEAIVSAPIPFRPVPLRVLDPRGTVWTVAIDGSYRLVEHALSGDTLRAVEREFTPVRISAAERARQLERFQGSSLDPDDLPEVYPPIEALDVTDGGFLWVWRHVEPERMAWDVFDPAGRYLGATDLPLPGGRFLPRSVTDDAVLGVWIDDLDVPWVVRAAIVRGAG